MSCSRRQFLSAARYRSFVDLYNDFRLPTYHTLGNHDTEANSFEETLDVYRMTCGHYFFDVGGFRFVVADNNYTRFGDGRTEHYSNCNGWRRPDAQNGWMPEGHCLAWGEPLSAIVTLSADGRVRIEGSRARWLFGVSPEKAGLPSCEETGVRRLTAPVIQSADLTFGALV